MHLNRAPRVVEIVRPRGVGDSHRRMGIAGRANLSPFALHIAIVDRTLVETLSTTKSSIPRRPLMQTYCPGLGRPRIRMVQFFGTDPSITELRGVICRPKDQDKVIKALTEHFLRHRGEWDVFRWNGLHHDPSAYNSPATCCEFLARHDVPAYIIELPGRWDELRARVSANMRKNLRKPYEFLERDGRNFRLRTVERPDDVQAAIDRFLSLHAAWSKVADMINHPNKFARSRNRAFLVDYLRQTAERGHLRIFELEIDGVVIASRLAFLLGPDLYLYSAGYDPSWRKYSVMTILVCEMIKWAIAHGLQRVNLSIGNDQSKLRWKTVEIFFHDAVQVSPSRRGRLLFPAFRAYEGLSHFREELAADHIRSTITIRRGCDPHGIFTYRGMNGWRGSVVSMKRSAPSFNRCYALHLALNIDPGSAPRMNAFATSVVR